MGCIVLQAHAREMVGHRIFFPYGILSITLSIMGKTQKKNSKGRLDRYYYLAKEKGYRARSSFKLVQINEKYGHFLEKSKVVVDLCAAPGSWCQVASNLCPMNSLIVGVDVVPMKPLPKCILFQSDITTEDCRSKLRGHLKTWKADTFLHDGAPNVGLGWVQDAFTQSQLVLKALKLAVEHLIQGGTFVTKVFRSKDYNNLMWVFQQLFDKVEATKPPASRNVSAEIFVVCKGFKAPKKIDNRLLELTDVFEEIGKPKDNNEAKVFNPEKRTRKREGYEEGDNILFKEMNILDFIRDEEPINRLGELNRLTIPADSQEWKILRKLKLWSSEQDECAKDLKVLGKKEFKRILKFRKNARKVLQLDESAVETETRAETNLTEEEQINQELAHLSEKQRQKRKREKKAANEIKQREIKRLQMNMLTDMSIGIDAANNASQTLFNLKTAHKTGEIESLANGKKSMVLSEKEKNTDTFLDDEMSASLDTEMENDDLEEQLNTLHAQFKQRRLEKDANYRAKLNRGYSDDGNWDGIASDADTENTDSDQLELENSSDDSDDEAIVNMIERRQQETKDLSMEARAFFALNPMIGNIDDATLLKSLRNSTPKGVVEAKEDDLDSSTFDVVKSQRNDDNDISSDEVDSRKNTHASNVQLDTVEAMTLAHQVALGQKSKHDLVNEGINRYSFRDSDALPEWFIEDEKRHSRIIKPITKEAAAAIKEKQKQLNSRPIKKILEAQGRKKMRAIKRLEKIKKKSDLINEDADKSERDKADEIQRMMRKLSKKEATRPKPTLVVAKGHNRGLSGRPKGVKGKYKMVDGVMKNEQRALRRIAKKRK